MVKEGAGFSLYDPSTAGDFEYKIVVTDITPKTGGVLGGAEITITGIHFSKSASDNNVFFIDTTNYTSAACPIISASATQIVCKAPAKLDSFANTVTI